MVKNILLFVGFLFIPSLIYSQLLPYTPRHWDTNWTYTRLDDSFIGMLLDTSKWEVTKNYGRGKCVFLDAEGTTYSVNNGLNLNMCYQPGFSYYNYDEEKYYWPDYISAEIVSRDSFKYGIYEGQMKFATGKGSWPAFWFWGNSGADDSQYNNGYASEIDIAEHNWHRNLLGAVSATTDHVFHWWWPKSIYGTREMDIPDGIKENSVDWNAWHTFKLIYTPYDVKFYIDGTLNLRRSRFYTTVCLPPDYYIYPIDIFYEDINANTEYFEYEWFPKHAGHIILSQQVANNVDNISAPQTSLFKWVKYKQFFLAPVITAHKYICSSGTATLDVDPLASNITWQLTPSSLFTTSSGTGKIANVVRAAGAVGTGNIQYTFQMPSGETFTTNKQISVGNSLPTPVISGNTTVKCGYELTYKLDPTNANNGETFQWDSDILVITQGETASQCKVMGGDWNEDCTDCRGVITCTVTACGISKTSTFNIRLICESALSLTISPNPSTTETTIELVKGEEKIPVEDLEWSLEIYDQSQNLKSKVSNGKVNKHVINTSGWKEGLYIVRAVIGDEIITEKLKIEH